MLRLRLEGRAFAEIGESLGIDETAARKRFERAYTQLRKAITKRSA